MDTQQVHPLHTAPSPFPPVPVGSLKPPARSYDATMDRDMCMTEDDRTQRAASVLSGMSMEDMEAAETLKNLQASMAILSS